MTNLNSYILAFGKERDSFTIDEIMNELGDTLYSPDKSVLKVLLTRLVKSGRLVRVGRGTYAVSDKQTFYPSLSESAIRIYTQVKSSFPLVKLCVYEGNWIAPMLHHLASNQMVYIEVERDASEIVYHHLQNQDFKVHYNPNLEIMNRYVDLNEPEIIVKNLVSEAPLLQIDNIPVSSLEKLLVDIYSDADFFYLQGGEYNYIMENAMSLFTINKSRLLRYASRRGVKKEIELIIENIK